MAHIVRGLLDRVVNISCVRVGRTPVSTYGLVNKLAADEDPVAV